MWGAGAVTMLLAILALSAAIRLYLFQGYVGLDDGEYARIAHQMAENTFRRAEYTGPAVFPLRIGIVAPAALVFSLFGSGEWAMVLFPLAMSLLGIVLMYVCASLTFGPRAGLIATSVLGVFPWDIESATTLLADMPAAVFAAAGVTVLIALDRTSERQQWGSFAGGAAAGLAFGLSWLCKESVAYLAPFCVIWALLLLRRHGISTLYVWGGVAVGSLAVLVGEMVVYHGQTGDLLFRFHEIERNYRQWENSFFTEGSDFGWQRGESYSQALRNRLFVIGPTMIFLSRTFLFLPLIGLGVTAYAVIRRDRAFVVPVIWFWTLVLMFNFSSSSSETYTPLALFHRYLYPIFFPSILLVSGFLSVSIFSAGRASTRRQVRFTRVAGLLTGALIGWVAASELWLRISNPSTWLADVRAMRAQVTPETVIYSDALTLRALEFYAGYPPRTAWTDLQAVDSAAQIRAESLVLIYPPGIEWLDRNAGMWVAWPDPGPTDASGYLRNHFSRTPPPSWAPVWQRGDVTLYRVGDFGQHIISKGVDQ